MNLQTQKIDIHVHTTIRENMYYNNICFSNYKDLLKKMDELHIKRACIMSLGSKGKGISSNQVLHKICQMEPKRFSWFCNIDIDDTKIEQTILDCKNNGAIGLGELAINLPLDSPLLQQIYYICENINMPILFHMSPEQGNYYGIVDKPGLPLLERMLIKFPKLIFIGHSQAFWHEISGDADPNPQKRNSYSVGPAFSYGRLITLLDQYPNLYCDLSANSGSNAILRDEEFGLTFIKKYQDRLMFGTDMANTKQVFPLGYWLEQQYKNGRINDEIYTKICYKNANKVLKLNC